MGYDNFNKLIRLNRCMQTIENKDIVMAITGVRGSGKSSFSISHARGYIRKYFNTEYFNIKKYIAFSNSQINEKINTLPMYSPIIGDEALQFAWSREWNKSDSKDLIKVIGQARPKKFIFYLNLPKLSHLDKMYRESFINLWVWVHSIVAGSVSKHYAIIFMPDSNQGEVDSWHLKELIQKTGRIKRIDSFTDIDRLYKIVKNHPCFVDMFEYPAVPKDIYDEYLKYREEGVKMNDLQYVDQKHMAKIICWNLKNNYDNFIKKINEGRFQTPAYWMIADILCNDPTRKERLVRHTTVRNWIEEINKMVAKPKTLETFENAINTSEGGDEGTFGEADGDGTP